MIKTRTGALILTTLALVGVNLLASCAPKGSLSPSGGRAAAPGEITSGPAPLNTVIGTSDSGGGTGIDGKVFESYVVNPTTLPAYVQFVKPLLDNLTSEDPNDHTQYEQIFKIKTWYIAPVDLDKIGKDLLGVSFIKSNTQQIARQTMKEVWIDKNAWDQMGKEGLSRQADLLVHEFVMNLYFFKFLSMSDVCRQSTLLMGDKDGDGCTHPDPNLDKAMPAEALRPLNDQDNANIRFVTAWLIQHAQKPIPEKDFVRVLLAKGFDKRLFQPASYGDKDKPEGLQITGLELYRAIKGGELTGNMPNECVGLASNATSACTVRIAPANLAYQGLNLPSYTVSVAIAGASPITLSFFLGEETKLSASTDGNGGILYSEVLVDWRDKVRIGDRIYSGVLLFRKENATPHSGLVLDSLVVRPGIVVSTDKKRDPVCLMSAPKINALVDDTLLIQPKGTSPNLVQKTYAAAPPMAACEARNVDE